MMEGEPLPTNADINDSAVPDLINALDENRKLRQEIERLKGGEGFNGEGIDLSPESRDAVASMYTAWPEPVDIHSRAHPTAFPLDILPDSLRGYVEDQADRMGVDAGMLAMFGIGVCAAALSDEVQVQVKTNDPSWRESARIWIAAVGNPSIKKSPALSAMLIPLKNIDRTWRKYEEADVKDFQLLQDVYKKKYREYTTALAKGKDGIRPDEPKQQTQPRAYTQDTTIEALGTILARDSRGTLCLHDELSGFFGGMDAYRANGANKDRAHYLELYNGGGRSIDRINRGSFFVENWSASLIGAIQPEPMAKIAKNIKDDGLLQRFNIFLASNATEDHDRVRKDTHFANYETLIDRLTKVKPSAKPISMSEQAQAMRVELATFSRSLQGVQSLPVAMRTALGKWEGQFARYALLFHAIDCIDAQKNPTENYVHFESAERALRLFKDFLLPHLFSFYSDVIGTSEHLEHARWLAGYMLSRNLETIDRRTIKKGYRAMRQSSDWSIHSAMDLLCSYGWAQEQIGQFPPFARWNINPKIHARFAELAKAERSRREREREALQDVFKNARKEH